MTVFADTSAVVKIYVDEPSSSRVRSLEAMYVADLTRVELPAALWRKSRTGALDRKACGALVRRFEQELDRAAGILVPVLVGRDALRRASDLTGMHGLRAYDAVQLSVAMGVAEVESSCRTFASLDRDLNLAARREGFELLAN